MTTVHEIRNLIEQTTTGTRRRRVPEEVKQQVRRYAERRRAQGASWQAIARETALEARKIRTWCPSTDLVLVASTGLRIEGLGVEEAARLIRLLA
jgi:hypothetical protein